MTQETGVQSNDSRMIFDAALLNTENHKVGIKGKVNQFIGGAHGVMVIVEGNGHGDTSSNPGRD